MHETETEVLARITLENASEAIEALRSAGSSRQRTTTMDPAEDLLLSMWLFRKDPQQWYSDAAPLMRRLAALKSPRFYGEDDKELFEGLVADAKSFVEHREMTNLPRLLRR